ncbi:MAG: SLC13 family permease, partial [Acidobacteria bacterium]|nr:SLC13 family permease [Acidobacteriota bacterium]
LCGASILILIVRISPQRIFSKIDLSILLFFAGLFVVIGAMEEIKVFDYFADYIPEELTLSGSYIFSLLTVLFSNFFSNVPFVMVALKWASKTATSEYYYYLLAVISTLAGNLTLIGSMANLIVVEMAKGTRIVGFREYFRFGLVITFLSCLISVFYLFIIFKFVLIIF